MKVSLTPDVEARLRQIAHESGRAAADLAHDAIAGYVDELNETRKLLDSRYDDIKSGKVTLVPGDEVFARLRARSQAKTDSRRSQSGS